ncbi:ATP-binding cassette domain-containing protein [Streptomyces sp. NPDC059262]|uniref:ATP-binding cassette domain-containing protein n=1 Tax=Streptomyces sp. NPDC059262 TaxID=3346797 RepID=UPI0036A10F75
MPCPRRARGVPDPDREGEHPHPGGGRRPRRGRRARRLGLPALGHKLGQLAGSLSGGQQQMLALAHAYVTDADYVLLDEVSMGLAPVVVDEIFEFLGRLADDGRALLLVEQYVARALALADYVYLMNRGRIEFAGEPGELDSDRLVAQYLGAHT